MYIILHVNLFRFTWEILVTILEFMQQADERVIFKSNWKVDNYIIWMNDTNELLSIEHCGKLCLHVIAPSKEGWCKHSMYTQTGLKVHGHHQILRTQQRIDNGCFTFSLLIFLKCKCELFYGFNLLLWS